MSRVDATKLLNKKIRSKDGMLVGYVRGIEIDLASLRFTGIKCETSRDLLERLSLSEPAVTGGRMTIINTDDVEAIDDEVTLKVDALDLARLNFRKLDSII
jgi:sporulation protein YlmC with PRC-barrel domain